VLSGKDLPMFLRPARSSQMRTLPSFELSTSIYQQRWATPNSTRIFSNNASVKYLKLALHSYSLFLGALEKLRKRTISSGMSVRPSVCTHGTIQLPMDGFAWNFKLENFSKICLENSIFIKTGQE